MDSAKRCSGGCVSRRALFALDLLIHHKPLMMYWRDDGIFSLNLTVRQNLDFAKDDDAFLAVGATVVPRLQDEGGSVSPILCCNGANVARSTADVGEAILSTSSLAAVFSSVHRDNG